MKHKFAIIASCDPYHAKCHHHGEEVIERIGPTPVKWIHSTHETEDEAKKALSEFANDTFNNQDDHLWYDDDYIKDYPETMADNEGCEPEDIDTSWYKGEGWYNDAKELVFKEGDTGLTDDVMSYLIYSAKELKEYFGYTEEI